MRNAVALAKSRVSKSRIPQPRILPGSKIAIDPDRDQDHAMSRAGDITSLRAHVTLSFMSIQQAPRIVASRLHIKSHSHALHYAISCCRYYSLLKVLCSFTRKVSTFLKSHYLTYLVTARRRSFSNNDVHGRFKMPWLVIAGTLKYDPLWR